jgi:hypothetical protein
MEREPSDTTLMVVTGIGWGTPGTTSFIDGSNPAGGILS